MSLASLNCISARAVFDIVTNPECANPESCTEHADVHIIHRDDSIIEAVPVPVATAHFREARRCDYEHGRAVDPKSKVLDRFEHDFNAFLNEHPSKLPSRETVEALRARLVKVAEDRVNLEEYLLSQLEEEKRKTNEIETILSRQIESAKKSKEDVMAKFHEELVEVKRSKAVASETNPKGTMTRAEKDKLNANAEERIKHDLYLKEKQRQMQLLDRHPSRGALMKSVVGASAQPGYDGINTLHAEHVRMKRIPPQRKTAAVVTTVGGLTTRSTSEGGISHIGSRAVEPWDVAKSVTKRSSGPRPQTKQLENSGLSEEVLMLRERWEIENKGKILS